MIWQRKMRSGVWGPWHQGTDHHLTLCGRRMPGLTDWREGTHPPPDDERRCDDCARRAVTGEQKSYRR